MQRVTSCVYSLVDVQMLEFETVVYLAESSLETMQRVASRVFQPPVYYACKRGKEEIRRGKTFRSNGKVRTIW